METSKAFFEALQQATNEELETLMEYTATEYKESDVEWNIYKSCQDILDMRQSKLQ